MGIGSLFCCSGSETLLCARFDNSGHRISPPYVSAFSFSHEFDGKAFFRGWYTNNTDVQRTDAIIKTIASMFRDQTGTVPIIAPLNELSRSFRSFPILFESASNFSLLGQLEISEEPLP
jgi:hypothetical protein